MAAKWMLNQEKGNFNMLLTFEEIYQNISWTHAKEQKILWPHTTKITTFAKRIWKVAEQKKDDCSLQQSERANSGERVEFDF